MFTSEHRKITRRCEVQFPVDLREETHNPVRADRGLLQTWLPRPVTVDEGPFSFTLSHRPTPERGEDFAIEFDVSRKSATGDPSLDGRQTISDVGYFPVGTETMQLSESPGELASGRHAKTSIEGYYRWTDMRLLYGKEEPLVAKMAVSFKMEADFDAPSTSGGAQAGESHPLDSLGSFVSSRSPNNVVFILASSPLRPLYSNKSILSAASPYFKTYFDPPGFTPRRSSKGAKRTLSFVDDSDAESDAGSDGDLEMLIPPSQLGSQRSGSKRKSPEPSPSPQKENGNKKQQQGEDNEESDVKRESASPEKGDKSKRKKKAGSRGSDVEVKGEGGVVEIHVDDGSYSTLRAIFVYLLSGHIEFAPLSSQGREAFIKEYSKKYPERPVPVSPRSVYRLATRFELTVLQGLSLAHLKHSLTLEAAIQEAFTDDCHHFPDYCSAVHELITESWSKVKDSQTWKETLKQAEKGQFTHSNSLLPKLLLKVC